MKKTATEISTQTALQAIPRNNDLRARSYRNHSIIAINYL